MKSCDEINPLHIFVFILTAICNRRDGWVDMTSVYGRLGVNITSETGEICANLSNCFLLTRIYWVLKLIAGIGEVISSSSGGFKCSQRKSSKVE